MKKLTILTMFIIIVIVIAFVSDLNKQNYKARPKTIDTLREVLNSSSINKNTRPSTQNCAPIGEMESSGFSRQTWDESFHGTNDSMYTYHYKKEYSLYKSEIYFSTFALSGTLDYMALSIIKNKTSNIQFSEMLEPLNEPLVRDSLIKMRLSRNEIRNVIKLGLIDLKTNKLGLDIGSAEISIGTLKYSILITGNNKSIDSILLTMGNED